MRTPSTSTATTTTTPLQHLQQQSASSTSPSSGDEAYSWKTFIKCREVALQKLTNRY